MNSTPCRKQTNLIGRKYFMPPIDTDNFWTLHNIDLSNLYIREDPASWRDVIADITVTPDDNDRAGYYADIVTDRAGAASQYYINGLKDFAINGVRQDIVSGYDGGSEEECPDDSTKSKVTWEEVFY